MAETEDEKRQREQGFVKTDDSPAVFKEGGYPTSPKRKAASSKPMPTRTSGEGEDVYQKRLKDWREGDTGAIESAATTIPRR